MTTPRRTYVEPTAPETEEAEEIRAGTSAAMLDRIARIFTGSRTSNAAAARVRVLKWMVSPTGTQSAAARQFGITPRRFRQIVREIREDSISP